MKKRVLAVLLTLCLVVGLMPAAAAAGNTFADVDPDAWYGDEVAYVYKEGLMNGIDAVNGLFDPTGTTSRAMVWAILARMDGETISGAAWVEQARAWAMANGVSDGTDPDGIITREMFATMLYRYAISKGYDVSVGEDTNILSYPDAFGVSEWAVPAMQWAVGAGIITNLDGQLAPKTGAQRCMVAVMLYRVCENVVKPEAEPEPTPTPTPAPTPSRPVDPDYYVHYHSWDQGVVTTDPTCTADGVKTFTCYCGDTYTETVNATGHTYDAVVTAPTCTAKGYTTYTCSVCGDSYTDGTVEKTGHTYESVVTAPTCTAEGYTTYTCSVCGHSYVDDETNATGHKWGEFGVTKEPTCTAKGEKTRTCKVCNATETEKVNTVPHNWNNGVVTTQPTCTAKGEKTYTCTVCRETKTEKVATVAHSWNDGVVTAPTCTEDGYTTYTCTVCDASYEDAHTNATGHSWNDGEITTATTCTIPGEKTFTCTACATKKVESIAAPGHTWGDEYTDATAGHCTTATLHTCSTCNTVEQVSSGASAHVLSGWTPVDGEEQHTRNCLNTVSGTPCTYTETDTHYYGAWTYKNFVATRTCTKCNYREEETGFVSESAMLIIRL